MKQVLLVRHAKSRWDEFGVTDHDRGLNTRGLKAAPMMARRLLDNGVALDAIISSTAKRARLTASFIAEALAVDVIETRSEIYGASPVDLFELIKGLFNTWEKVALVGHNPELTYLVNQLSPAREIANIPTCGMAMLAFDVQSWHQVRIDNAQLQWFDYPKRKV